MRNNEMRGRIRKTIVLRLISLIHLNSLGQWQCQFAFQWCTRRDCAYWVTGNPCVHPYVSSQMSEKLHPIDRSCSVGRRWDMRSFHNDAKEFRLFSVGGPMQNSVLRFYNFACDAKRHTLWNVIARRKITINEYFLRQRYLLNDTWYIDPNKRWRLLLIYYKANFNWSYHVEVGKNARNNDFLSAFTRVWPLPPFTPV